ncbi:MAG: flagellar hook-length control protein FliK, partial [Oscillospiraceae bacterium]
ENREQTEYSMVLNPEELGRITVKLVKAADGAVSVTIVAENASTQRMLEQHGELMQSNLRANGVQLQSWQTVNEAHQETMQREYDGSSKNPYYREENENPDDEQSEGESFADIIAAM